MSISRSPIIAVMFHSLVGLCLTNKITENQKVDNHNVKFVSICNIGTNGNTFAHKKNTDHLLNTRNQQYFTLHEPRCSN